MCRCTGERECALVVCKCDAFLMWARRVAPSGLYVYYFCIPRELPWAGIGMRRWRGCTRICHWRGQTGCAPMWAVQTLKNQITHQSGTEELYKKHCILMRNTHPPTSFLMKQHICAHSFVLTGSPEAACSSGSVPPHFVCAQYPDFVTLPIRKEGCSVPDDMGIFLRSDPKSQKLAKNSILEFQKIVSRVCHRAFIRKQFRLCNNFNASAYSSLVQRARISAFFSLDATPPKDSSKAPTVILNNPTA